MTEDFRGPAARRFDWQHILDRHSENGIIAQQSRETGDLLHKSQAATEEKGGHGGPPLRLCTP